MSDQDPYVYPGTSVLRNRPGLRDVGQLQQYEYRRTAERALGLIEQPIAGALDLDHLKRVHRYLFQDVYDWAGQIRTVGITKDTSTFAMPSQIESYGRKVFNDLARENHLQGLGHEAFVGRLAFHFSEINALHPFREGNGRATRVFLAEIGRQAGHEIDYAGVQPAAWNNASRSSFLGDLQPITELFRTIVRPVSLERAESPAAVPARLHAGAEDSLTRAFEGALDAKGVPAAARDALREHFRAELAARQARGEAFGVKVYDAVSPRERRRPDVAPSKAEAVASPIGRRPKR